MLATPPLSFLCACIALALAGCGERKAEPAPIPAPSPATPTAAAPAASATDKWLGKWNGPEGTFLQLAGGGGRYVVTIQNLDGPRSFQGTAAGEQIAFERDGVKEVLRATNGAGTGMKWFTEKSDCLAVRTGEGYCRD